MQTFFLFVLSNALVAGAMAAAIIFLGLRLRRPAVLHFLWIAVLLKLFLPPIFDFGILPAQKGVSVAAETAAMISSSEGAEALTVGLSTGAILLMSGLAIWLLGSLVALGLTLVRMWRFRRLVTESRPADLELRQKIEQMASLVGCKRQPLASVTDASISPLVWSSLGRPRLVLPRRLLEKLNDGQRDTIVAHELAHLKRGDDRVRWIELAALVIFWWNPTTWVASRYLRDAEEACCDAIVAKALPGQVKDYASGLVETIRHLMIPEPSRLVAASGLGRPATIERRITMMFSKRISLPLSLSARVIVIVTALAALGLSPVLTAREEAVAQAPSSQSEFTGDPINLTIEDADIRDVLSTFSKLADVEILIDPDVSAKVTLNVQEMPWDQALDLILRSNGLAYSIDHGVIHVGFGQSPEVLEKHFEPPEVVGEVDGRPLYRFNEHGPITQPKRIDGPNPRYPEQARKEGVNGVVVLECIIGEDGIVREVEMVRTNADILTDAAIEAVEQWVFEPATLEGVPVSVRFVLTVKFSLK